MLSKDHFVSPKPFWRWLNSYKGHHTSVPPLLHHNSPLLHHNGHVSDDISKAEAFNAYFSSVFTVDDCSDISTLQKDLSFQPSIIQTIEFNVEEVCNELQNLSCGKACGPDLLPARLLRVGAELIAPSLTHLLQLSLCSSKLPLDWTSTNVVPIHKKETNT